MPHFLVTILHQFQSDEALEPLLLLYLSNYEIELRMGILSDRKCVIVLLD
jgi:predicted AAA+ superfamily ATPase